MSLLERLSAYWQDTLNFLLGAGLFFSPWLFGFGAEQPAAFNAYVVGAIIAVMALMALFAFQIWEEWVSGLLGAWLVISPGCWVSAGRAPLCSHTWWSASPRSCWQSGRPTSMQVI